MSGYMWFPVALILLPGILAAILLLLLPVRDAKAPEQAASLF